MAKKIEKYLPVDYSDSFSIEITENRLSPKDIILKVFAHNPAWLRMLYAIRACLVKPFGIETKAIESEELIIEEDKQEAIMRKDDKHLLFYVDIFITPLETGKQMIEVTTLVKYHNWVGWEKMQRQLDDMFKETGHVNAYFPLLIPKSYLSREAEHVEGFAKECAVVTHYRLKNAEDGSGVIVDPAAKLEEELIIRPTSETIIWSTYKNWINSYRDLPILCNQWANVMRWEMRTRLFLRTAEFLWQEGHTAHATREEAEAEAQKMLHVYGDFAEKYMAVPVIKGVKSANERFAGALDTYTIEGLMQDGKALQCGTSHFLGQNFAKAFNVQFVDKNNKLDYVWATSWGVSTRLMGALIMTHSDDNGLVLPPHLAPIQVVIVPIYKNDEMLKKIDAKVEGIVNKLKAMGISVKYDNADNKRPGFKFADYELKGVPVRLVMGGRDLENNTMEVMRRDTLEKETRSCDGIEEYVQQLLEDIQNNIYQKALNYRNEHIVKVDSYDDFKKDSLEDKVLGLELGADDYLPKPFHLVELNARIKSVIRRHQHDGEIDIRQGNVRIEPDKYRVFVNEQEVELNRKRI